MFWSGQIATEEFTGGNKCIHESMHIHDIYTHTLAQNCHCEFCCGVRLTCKNNSFKTDRSRSLKGPEKQWKAAIAIASANWRKLEADPFQQSHIAPNLTDCENRARSAKSKIKLFENGMVGLGLATSHHRILT
jgi:hypothetical protein